MTDHTSAHPANYLTNNRQQHVMLAAALGCVDDFYARMFRDWTGAVTRRENGFTLSYSGNAYLTGANHIWSHHLTAFTPTILTEATRFFAGYDAAWSVICAEPAMVDTLARLYAHNFSLRWDAPVMILDSEPNTTPTAPHTRVIQAENRQHLYDLTRILSEAFSTGQSVNRRVVRHKHLEDPNVRHYMIYQGVHPACGATVVLHTLDANQRMASIWNVGTRPRFRRRRYASTIMQDLLADLHAEGITTSMLLASPSGFPLYESLGYRTLGKLAYLAPPR